MITLRTLSWNNCFSYGEDNTLELNNEPLTQIIGVNGTGKSSIPLIIEEVLYNKNSKNIKKADIANRYIGDGYSISLEFTKDDKEYTISVTRKGAKVRVVLLADGEDISSHTATNTYKTLQEILGLDFKTFSQLVYQSTNTSLQFLSATDTNRKKFLIELLDLNKKRTNELTRVGVIICNCNTEISSVINIDALEEYIRNIRSVVSVKILDNFCQEKYLKNIKDWVKENFINKIVIGACSPKSHQHVFERIFEGIINNYNIEYANIREQCCWVHFNYADEALKKAQILIEAAVERVNLQEKILQKKIEVVKKVAILGGGVAGMTLALNLARAGIKVYLIEKSPNYYYGYRKLGFVYLARDELQKAKEAFEKANAIFPSDCNSEALEAINRRLEEE